MLHKPALGRIDSVSINPDMLRHIFINLAESAEEAETEGLVLEYSFDDPADEYEVGQYVPQMLFQVRKIVPEGADEVDDESGE